MKAHDMMIEDVYKVKDTDTIRTVIHMMIDHRISGMPVINDENDIVGYINNGNIMRYIGKHQDFYVDSFFTISVVKGDQEGFDKRVKHILDLNAMELAHEKVFTTTSNTEIEEIAGILGEKQLKKLPVERDGKLIGIITRGDIIRNTFKTIL